MRPTLLELSIASLLWIGLFSSGQLSAQQEPTKTKAATTPPAGLLLSPPPSISGRDPQALNVLTQAVAVGGGAQAVGAITDYTATGTITYHRDQDRDEQGSVTIKGLGLDHFRMDSFLAGGTLSVSVRQGRTTIKDDHGTRQLLTSVSSNVGSSLLPSLALATSLQNTTVAVAAKRATQLNGGAVSVIRVQATTDKSRDLTGLLRDITATDFYIDSTTSQIVMTQDTLRSPGHPGIPHQLHYSDYRPINGVLVPFSISESVNGQQGWVIQLSNISFSSGLQDADFTLSSR